MRLRTSDVKEEYDWAAQAEAPIRVWLEVISNFPDMKIWVILNKMVPLEILEILARDESQLVRSTVADKRKLSLELFELLARDHDDMVRHRIACNKKAPQHLLQQLMNDVSPYVRDMAIKRLREE